MKDNKTTKYAKNTKKDQLFNYLKASGMKLGLLVNFGHFPKAMVERIAYR